MKLARPMAALASAALILAAALTPASAQYPTQTVRVIVPFGAGGVVDTIARQFANHLTSSLGQTFIVENRLGAGGKIAEEFVSRAAPDGHTLLVNFATRAVLAKALATDEADVDVRKAFSFPALLASSPLIMTVPASLGVKNFAELVTRLTSEPGKHSYGTPGPATPAHVMSAALANRYKLQVSHVPYRGGAAVQADLATGILVWSIDTPLVARPIVESGKTVPMFVVNDTRVKSFPDTPTALEVGLKEFGDQALPVFLMAPPATPEPILNRLGEGVRSAQRDPALRKSLEALELIVPDQPVDTARTRHLVEEQVAAWSRMIDLMQPAK